VPSVRAAVGRLLPERLRQRLRVTAARTFETFGSHRYSSPGLRGLDAKVRSHLGTRPGVFLEIGANDGYDQSNTYYLERVLGWRGILIEPIPRLYEAARRLRKRSTVYQRACVGPGGPTTIDIVDVGLMSVALGLQDAEEQDSRVARGRRTARRYSVPTATLSDLIDEAGETGIDFMSVDVEGAEFEVLRGLDLSRHAPAYLLVETKHPDRISELLGDRLELVEQLTEHDYLFRRSGTHPGTQRD